MNNKEKLELVSRAEDIYIRNYINDINKENDDIILPILKQLKKSIYEDVIKENCKGLSNGKVVDIINKQLKEIAKKNKNRPILGNSVIIDLFGENYLAFTNTYYAMFLRYQEGFNNVINPNQELLSKQEYPNLKAIVEDINARNYSNISLSFDKAYLQKQLLDMKIYNKKENKTLHNQNNKTERIEYLDTYYTHFENTKGWFDNNYLIKICDLIGYENLSIKYSENCFNAILIQNSNGDFGVLCPIK